MQSDMVFAALAAIGATTATNPIEVVKTRLQLQGELAKRSALLEPYNGMMRVAINIAKNEGVLSLQKGLMPALCFNSLYNCLRLGIYNYALDKGWVHDKKGNISFGLGLFWGAFGGAVGAYASSPFFMVKTQLQAQAVKATAVGFQHKHKGMLDAFSDIYGKGGIRGLWRGSAAGVTRTAIGSASLISLFGVSKSFLQEHDFVAARVPNSFCAALLAGTVASVTMSPFDVVSTRLYNQGVDGKGKGLLYNGWYDCLVKVFRTEGLHGLFKGFWPGYMRIAPHTTLLLLFFDELLVFKEIYWN